MAIIEMSIEGGKHGPVVMCDVCGKSIEKAEDGHVVYKETNDLNIEKQVLFVHSGACHDHLEVNLAKAYGGWNHLNHYFYWLLHNTQYEQPEHPPFFCAGP